MIILDACVLIAHMEAGHPHAARALEILDTEEELIVHPITMAECAVGPARVNRLGAFRHGIEQLHVAVWTPDEEQWARIALLRVHTSLKTPDCCVLDTARSLGATLATFDETLARRTKDLGIFVDDGLTPTGH